MSIERTAEPGEIANSLPFCSNGQKHPLSPYSDSDTLSSSSLANVSNGPAYTSP